LREGATRYATLAVSIGATKERATEELEVVWHGFEGGNKKGAGR
jgi:hypothetical protein